SPLRRPHLPRERHPPHARPACIQPSKSQPQSLLADTATSQRSLGTVEEFVPASYGAPDVRDARELRVGVVSVDYQVRLRLCVASRVHANALGAVERRISLLLSRSHSHIPVLALLYLFLFCTCS
ncbi:hypothetical protein K466DRAFT_668686, partial [Polyporus arcularius HHB13444]